MLRLRAFRGALSALASADAGASRAFAVVSPNVDISNVPEGHHKSVLNTAVCNIGLGRRRDVTLRSDVKFAVGDSFRTLRDTFKGKKVIVFGLPGGKVCDEQNLPAYLKSAQSLKDLGVDEVVCVRPEGPEEVQGWAAKHGVDPARVSVVSDGRGAWVRLLGVDIPGGSPAKHHRYSLLVEDGCVLRMCVEEHPATFDKTKPERMAEIYKEFFAGGPKVPKRG
ncbi:unnamed protein product [Pedinophyceae sp. YPF-701]|nr:unnamed protein product [Pedinophyceae sp. YPF-701]